MKKDTIAAISTAQLPAGIAVIRISGSESISVTDSIFIGKKPLKEASSHSQHFGVICDNDDKIDEVLVSVMRAPNTYTGEDVCEISCHGSLLIQKKVLQLLIDKGARLAEPGEFTMRAFLNHRMDLTQAEAVMDIISAENEVFLKKSINNLSGNFAALITEFREKIIENIAFIEAALDDPEHISLLGFSERLEITVGDIIKRLDDLITTHYYSKVYKDGVDCAIIGRVNVGKSSLLNAISLADRSIVTAIPGTTRDAIEQRVTLGNMTLNFIDTAGIRESQDEIENIGIEKSKRLLKDSDFVLLVLDGSIPLTDEDFDLIRALDDKKAIILINKSDLDNVISREEIKKISDKTVLNISAKKISGIDILADEIEKVFMLDSKNNNIDYIVVNERQLYNLKDARESLSCVIYAIKSGMTEEIFTVDLTDAYDKLGKILGLNLEDDVIETVFSKFCIGK